MKIICRHNRKNGDVYEFVIVENIKEGYEDMLLKPLVDNNTDKGFEYLLVDDNHKPYCYVNNISA